MGKKIIVICGPTGVGKTGLAIWLAKKFNGEIVGADSMQIYKYMDIGTAKPDVYERKMAVHHLVDILDPDEDFDAAKFTRMADSAIEKIINKGKLPIVAGGTGLYIKALLHGLFRQGRPVDKKIILKLETELQDKGAVFLHKKLTEIDPDSARKIHPNDSFRVIRALEVFQSMGKTLSECQREHRFANDRYDALKFGLYMDRKELYNRIDQRVDHMMNLGFIEEVKRLIEMGYSCELKSMQSLGYRHICDFFFKDVPFEETIRLLKRDTRRYAKRQFTWFGKDKEIIWLRPDEREKFQKHIMDFLENSE